MCMYLSTHCSNLKYTCYTRSIDCRLTKTIAILTKLKKCPFLSVLIHLL